tara:strand:- start:1422 stop:1547 length:126 start_codon:yes stop_codon:yes gene_type:complete
MFIFILTEFTATSMDQLLLHTIKNVFEKPTRARPYVEHGPA